MPSITTLTKQGCFDNDLEQQVNANFTNINAALASGAGLIPASALVANSVTSGQLDPQTIQYVTVTPTLANFINMFSVGVPLVAAQGAGTFIEPVSLLVNLQYGSAAFSAGAAVGVYVGTTSAGTLLTTAIAASVFTTFTASKIASTYPSALGSTPDATGILNTGLVLACPTQNFTGGTGATIVVKLAYRIHSGLA